MRPPSQGNPDTLTSPCFRFGLGEPVALLGLRWGQGDASVSVSDIKSAASDKTTDTRTDSAAARPVGSAAAAGPVGVGPSAGLSLGACLAGGPRAGRLGREIERFRDFSGRTVCPT